MTAKQEPVAMQRSQMGEVTDALARSFFDDPFVLYISPEDERRRRGLDAFMHVAARYALRHGHIHTTPGDPLGGAIWLPPGEAPARTLGLLRAGMLSIVPRIGLAATMRMTKALNKMDDVHKKEMTRAHWYLWILGVEPERQGQGVGSELISPTLRRADSENLPCYLETAKERNLTFYRKHGFEVVQELQVARDAPPLWTMLREPVR